MDLGVANPHPRAADQQAGWCCFHALSETTMHIDKHVDKHVDKLWLAPALPQRGGPRLVPREPEKHLPDQWMAYESKATPALLLQSTTKRGAFQRLAGRGRGSSRTPNTKPAPLEQ